MLDSSTYKANKEKIFQNKIQIMPLGHQQSFQFFLHTPPPPILLVLVVSRAEKPAMYSTWEGEGPYHISSASLFSFLVIQ
jgi:hypothetical protein